MKFLCAPIVNSLPKSFESTSNLWTDRQTSPHLSRHSLLSYVLGRYEQDNEMNVTAGCYDYFKKRERVIRIYVALGKRLRVKKHMG